MSSECKKCDCEKEQEKIEKECTKEKSCLNDEEMQQLDDNFASGLYKSGSSGSKKWSNREYTQAYMEKLYSSDNPERADCARRRKCVLRKKKDASEKCCNGMTGHHIVPGSALKGSLGGCYQHNNALTTCASGETNHKGMHGVFHKKLRERVKNLRVAKNRICQVKYPKMLDAAVSSFTDVTGTTCDEECIKIALRNNLQEQCPDANLDETDVDAVWGNAPGEGTANYAAAEQHHATAGFAGA